MTEYVCYAYGVERGSSTKGAKGLRNNGLRAEAQSPEAIQQAPATYQSSTNELASIPKNIRKG